MITETALVQKAFDHTFSQQTNQSTCVYPGDVSVTQDWVVVEVVQHGGLFKLRKLNILPTEILLCKKSAWNWTFNKTLVLKTTYISILK